MQFPVRLLLLLILLNTARAEAQRLAGRVRDAQTGEPVSGATIWQPATTRGTQTGRDGTFVLRGLPGGVRLVRISLVGYRSREIELKQTDSSDISPPILLQPSPIQLNDYTVTTTRGREENEFGRPEMSTVLSPRDLQQRPPRTLPEALVGATGVWLQKTNHGGGSPFVRGLTGQQTLILIDGIRLNNATFRAGPNQYLNTIDPQSVSQIDILRSSGSVAYGSDALGGVINVLTKTPQFSDKRTFTGRFFGNAATQGMAYSARTEIGYAASGLAVTGGVAYRKFGDLVAGRGLGRLTPTGYDQLSGDAKGRVRLSGRTIATVAYQDLEQDSVPVYHRVRLENYRYAQFDPQRRQLAYARLDHYFGYRWLRSAQLTASWQRQTEGRQSQRNTSPAAVYERDQTTTRGLTVLTVAEPLSFWRMQQGVDWYADAVRSSRTDRNSITGVSVPKRGLYPDGASMNSLALFSLHTLTFKRLTLTAGGRYQANQIRVPGEFVGVANRAGATVSPSAWVGNLGASLALLPVLRLVGSAQTAFRSPNIDDLGTLGIVDFRYEIPNVGLRPERALSRELGLKLKTDRLALSVLAYHNRLTDFITRVRAGTDSLQGYPVYLKENGAHSFIRGLEAELEYELLPKLLLYGGATYTYGQNVTAREPFRRIPPANGRLGLTYQRTGWWLRLEGLAAGAQRRLAKGDQDDNRIAKGGTPGWHVFNLNGGYRWKGLTLSAELQNLTNEAYRMHGSGVDGLGRSAWLSVLASW